MKLQKIIISNFRCFGKDPISVSLNDITGFIGHNSSGKTAMIAALLKLFGEKASDRIITRADFHIPPSKSLEDIIDNEFFIEAIFTFESLEEDGDSYDIPIFFKHLIVSEPNGRPYIRIRLSATWEKGANPDGIIDSEINFIHTSKDEILPENCKKATKRLLDSIKLIYIPAIRQPNEQLKNVSGTIMYRLLNSIKWTDDAKDEIKRKSADVESAFKNQEPIKILTSSLQEQWKAYHKDERYSNATINFSTTDLDTILKKVEVSFSPTELPRNYRIEELGDGLRSLFYLSIVDTMLDIEEKILQDINEKKESEHFDLKLPILTIIAMEEPENHISPQILGRVMEKLKGISDKSNSQSIVTSHSPSIVKRIDPLSIRYFRNCADAECSKIKEIVLPPQKSEAYKYVKEAIIAYPELYFAKMVILGEGDSEEIIIPKMIELKGLSVDSNEISVVPLGGRHVNHFWKLLNDLEIPHMTLLDLDREREGGGWGRIKYVLKQLIENGVQSNLLLKTEDGILSADDLESMHEWPLEDNLENLQSWIDFLEEYNVFFSSPLDIDFAMLDVFKEKYIEILEANGGPRITGFGTIISPKNHTKDLEKYIKAKEKKIKDSVRATLKAEGGDGSTYSDEDKELMIWYNYFFLTRGKPTTHRVLFAKNDLKYDEFPECLKKLIDTMVSNL